MSQQSPFRIGTRGSALALAQAHETRDRLLAAHPGLQESGIEIVVFRTTGDRILDRPLSEVGGKGLFTKELEEALLDCRIDAAVHSMKDVATTLPDGLVVDCFLPREDARDVLIARGPTSIGELPNGALIGTSSLRRQSQLLALRPDLRITGLRGNVGTRLNKVAEGEVDATLLALAGLRRLGQAKAGHPLATDELLPAVAQGAIGIERRADDHETAGFLAPLNHAETAVRVTAERAMLAILDGSCRTPIAGHAELLDGGRMRLRAAVYRTDGAETWATERTGEAADALHLGTDAGLELRRRAGTEFG